MNRYTLRVPAADAELATLRMLEWFPGGIEEQRDGDLVELSGFAERAPDPSLSESPVVDGWADAWRDFHPRSWALRRHHSIGRDFDAAAACSDS